MTRCEYTSNWSWASLSKVTEFQNGGAWKESEYVKTGIPVVRVTNCKDGTVDLTDCKFLPELSYEKYKKHELRVCELIVATVGSHPTQPGSVVGRTSVVPKSANGALLNQNAVRLMAITSIIEQRFLNYYSKTPQFRQYIIAHARGAANQVRMSIGLLKDMPVPLPPLSIQRRITAILSPYDDLIENNLRRIKIPEEIAQNLYREWFVKFRFPGHEKVKMVDSPLGDIPKGWEVSQFGNVADVKWGDTSTTKKSYIDDGYLAYSAAGPDGKLDHYDYDKDGVVLSAIGANCGLTWFTQGKWSCIKNTIRFWAKENCVSTEYLFFATLGKDFWPKRGAAQPFISQGDINNMSILLPQNNIVEKFTNFTKTALISIKNLSEKNIVLRHTRDILLQKLISGELDVSELDIEIKDDAA